MCEQYATGFHFSDAESWALLKAHIEDYKQRKREKAKEEQEVPKEMIRMDWQDQVMIALRKADHGCIPEVAAKYDSVAYQRTIGLCSHLQRQHGRDPFFLSCRKLAGVLGIDAIRANRILRRLTKDGILKCVAKGTLKDRKGTEWLYLPPIGHTEKG